MVEINTFTLDHSPHSINQGNCVTSIEMHGECPPLSNKGTQHLFVGVGIFDPNKIILVPKCPNHDYTS